MKVMMIMVRVDLKTVTFSRKWWWKCFSQFKAHWTNFSRYYLVFQSSFVCLFIHFKKNECFGCENNHNNFNLYINKPISIGKRFPSYVKDDDDDENSIFDQ